MVKFETLDLESYRENKESEVLIVFNHDLICAINKRVWTSAGTIRAVPDTVKKVPGLAPVLFQNNHGDLPSADNYTGL